MSNQSAENIRGKKTATDKINNGNNSVENIITQLLCLLPTLSLAPKEITRLVYSVRPDADFSGLNWLAAQPCFPQFYWATRCGNEESAALGLGKKFNSVQEGEIFLLENPQYPDMRICGLNGWEAIGGSYSSPPEDSAFFFLPRLEWQRDLQGQRLILTLFGEEDIPATEQFLLSLQPAANIHTLNTQIIQQHHHPQHDEWCRLLTLAIAKMQTDPLEKVVMARQTALTLAAPLGVADFLYASQQVNHQCYHFMLAFDKQQGFISSTPERLYLRQGKQLLTEALAGTVASSDDDQIAAKNARWLMEDSKNQHENLVVVDDICQQLQGRVSAVDVSPAEIIRLRKVQHLRRSINAVLFSASDSDCLNRLQPTAAVSGLPRTIARQFVTEHEPFERRWYAGSGGYISSNKSEFAVSLRCAEINGHHIYLYSGAGIVSDSCPEQEWQEIDNKAAGLISLLNNS